jgi:hypothetical protein
MNCEMMKRFGRESFQEAMKLIFKKDKDIDWQKLKFKVFDVPTHPGRYQDRYDFLGTIDWIVFECG